MAKLLPEAKQYESPESVAELSQLLNQSGGKTLSYAGGTSLAFSKPAVDRVVDLNRLPLKGCRITSNGHLEIGALTTIRELETDTEAKNFCNGIFPMTTDKLASTPLRNLITVGGNIAAGYAWCDLPVSLMAMDAVIKMAPDGKNLPLPTQGNTSLRRLTENNQVISHIIIPAEFKNARGAFTKYARTTSDLAMVSAAVTMHIQDNTMRSVRIVAGGLVSVPMRLTTQEMMLEGQTPDEALFEHVAGTIENLKIRPDTRASREFRLNMLRTMICRNCISCVQGDEPCR